jgi:hypothetical protein
MSSRDKSLTVRANSTLTNHVRACAAKEGISMSKYMRRLIKHTISQLDEGIPCQPSGQITITNFIERSQLDQLAASISIPSGHLINMAIYMDILDKKKKPA